MPVSIQDIYLQKEAVEQLNFVPKEAYNRLLISRGYYASFLFACELFKANASHTLVLSNNNYGSHQKIYESLIESNIPNLMYVGKILKKYHRLRKDSDYKLFMHITDFKVIQADKYFEECKERIEFFLKNGPAAFP